MELLAAFVGGFLGMVGAFAGVWLANRYQSRAQKRQTLRDTTVALYTELTSVEMLTSRMKASKILDPIISSHKPLSITELGLNVDCDFEDWFHVARVLAFFQKLGLYLRAGYLDEELARELMGDAAMLWCDHYLSYLVQDVDVSLGGYNAVIARDCINAWLEPYRAQLAAAEQQVRGEKA